VLQVFDLITLDPTSDTFPNLLHAKHIVHPLHCFLQQKVKEAAFLIEEAGEGQGGVSVE
jgi:hypothetical protein